MAGGIIYRKKRSSQESDCVCVHMGVREIEKERERGEREEGRGVM